MMETVSLLELGAMMMVAAAQDKREFITGTGAPGFNVAQTLMASPQATGQPSL